MSKIVGMCNPLLDICADVPTSFLEKYGLQANNAILAEEKHVPLYEDMKSSFPVEYIAGGAGQNSMRVCTWLLQEKGTCAYFGAVGKDETANVMRAAAQKDGVDVRYYDEGGLATGTCGVLVSSGGKDRSLVANLSAANTYTDAHLKRPENWKVVEGADYFYITGFFFTVSPGSIMAIGKHCVETGKTLCMNFSAPFLLEVPPFLQAFKDASPYVDVYFGNEAEIEAVAKGLGFANTTDITEMAKSLAMLPGKKSSRPRTVIITHGAEPTTIVIGDSKRIWSVKEYGILPASPDEIVDTNGAGDAFVGGFLAGIVKGVPIEECVAMANYAANVVIKRSGCTYPDKPSFKFRGATTYY
uniref:Adenosine kinase n=1 Tax=Chromera velia CCMP2878 TaxID=1169474 RepID=A0A0G4GE51_9ALVE|mmetsp:Transcript_50670/g.99669  ORF Transcript_50670/g.99669 Transcript_50670/m.99669 type:complete len:357 (+) Transcript_50670:154-1224(+)|eukprot:Cvel_21453.t1-p1 / transcript=Cvel_21453.t1 / gene=Cvel_21453 / organism=Chromera_velia_CCMP2878 / gene_product=Adenosine kinase 2, putative / transcript_product=Adenosine kinase 2, putative / location=Cvel_scaffold2013:8646-10755(+) / protein_length=356 / sequence_SO=supercontig / SO=protein_coding / is_pseudo=false